MGTTIAPLYLLDTNIVVYIQRGMTGVIQRLVEVGPKRVAISVMVLAELAYGVEKSIHQERNRKALQAAASELTVLPWEQNAIWHYARQYHRLKTMGMLIGHMDLLIAAHALAFDAVLVTNNTREFERIEGLRLENWVA